LSADLNRLRKAAFAYRREQRSPLRFQNTGASRCESGHETGMIGKTPLASRLTWLLTQRDPLRA
jgi:hypothetical protein